LELECVLSEGLRDVFESAKLGLEGKQNVVMMLFERLDHLFILWKGTWTPEQYAQKGRVNILIKNKVLRKLKVRRMRPLSVA
jgi:hypothetical protein